MNESGIKIFFVGTPSPNVSGNWESRSFRQRQHVFNKPLLLLSLLLLLLLLLFRSFPESPYTTYLPMGERSPLVNGYAVSGNENLEWSLNSLLLRQRLMKMIRFFLILKWKKKYVWCFHALAVARLLYLCKTKALGLFCYDRRQQSDGRNITTCYIPAGYVEYNWLTPVAQLSEWISECHNK